MPRLDNYIIRKGFSDKNIWLYGQVYGSDKFEDGSYIETSWVKEINEEYAVTRSTKYILGNKYDLPEYKSSNRFFFLRKGADAIHKTGNIRRDVYDAELIIVHTETDNFYIGNFVEGFGFVDVQFNKEDCREATEEDLDLCDHGKMDEVVF